MAEPLLRVENLVQRFGGIIATDHVSLDVAKGELHAIIGPNGAGKTTLISQLTGQLLPQSGTIRLAGSDITRVPSITLLATRVCGPTKVSVSGLITCFQMPRDPLLTLTKSTVTLPLPSTPPIAGEESASASFETRDQKTDPSIFTRKMSV